ncbi:hypothetical protein T03_3189 [Trichinella britovi]|uniref:Uncharacterized protein n=1 Tax=Trichinella britovi TaxID=45882 RepID=A0A0V1B8E6_TRIBR|nr:hypothetical protein T03_3189 [Trichinella britovi]
MEYDITRSVEMIKGQRRKEQYKALVGALFGDWLMTSAILLANYCDK